LISLEGVHVKNEREMLVYGRWREIGKFRKRRRVGINCTDIRY
jgi:hypothetical protein